MRLLWTMTMLAGCADYVTLDEACPNRVQGQGTVSNETARDGLSRLGCYRQFVGLKAGSHSASLQEVVDKHASYVTLHAPPESQLHVQVPGEEGYTGLTVLERVDAVDLDIRPAQDDVERTYWDLHRVGSQRKAGNVIDGWMDDPMARAVLLHPGWLGGGLEMVDYVPDLSDAEGETLTYTNLLAAIDSPSPANLQVPLVYPRDGQTGVPTDRWIDAAGDAYCGERLGYPLSVMVTLDGTPDSSVELVVKGASLHGPEGAVAIEERRGFDYGSDWGSIMNQVVFQPLEPLAPRERYTFEASLLWRGNGEEEAISVSFETGAEQELEPDPGMAEACGFEVGAPTAGSG